MKILFIDSNEPINNRSIKIIDSLNLKSNFEIVLATWKRDLSVNEYKYNVSRKYLFEKDSKLGDNFKKVYNLVSYYFFLKKINLNEKPDIIIASHFDMLFLSSLIKRSKQCLIYENLDIPTSYSFFILKVLKKIEKISLLKTNYIIHASRFYPQLYSFFIGKQQVIENLPKLNRVNINKTNRGDSKIIISFIGGIRYIRILIDLIQESIAFVNIEIRLHGEGHESEKLNDYVKNNGLEDKVKITGRYDYSAISELYLNSNFIWSAYPNTNYNVKYAISNKFHESIFFNVPGIYSENTKLGEFVEANGIGITVNPGDRESIRKVLKKISERAIDLEQIKMNIQEFGKKESNTWDQEIEKLISWISKKKFHE